MENLVKIRRLRQAEGLPISEVARVLDISRNTVKRALAGDGPPLASMSAARLVRWLMRSTTTPCELAGPTPPEPR
jgi:transcriptional regulator with XRE-family HTH domain